MQGIGSRASASTPVRWTRTSKPASRKPSTSVTSVCGGGVRRAWAAASNARRWRLHRLPIAHCTSAGESGVSIRADGSSRTPALALARRLAPCLLQRGEQVLDHAPLAQADLRGHQHPGRELERPVEVA